MHCAALLESLAKVLGPVDRAEEAAAEVYPLQHFACGISPTVGCQ
jgi:hypothetical protein